MPKPWDTSGSRLGQGLARARNRRYGWYEPAQPVVKEDTDVRTKVGLNGAFGILEF